MTAEHEVRSEVSEVAKVEIEEKCGLDMSSYENLPKVGGDCNGVKHVDDDDEEEVNGNQNGNVKDDPDGSYVFVSRSNSANSVDKVLNADCADEPKSVPKSSQIKDAEVQVGELNVQNGENTQLCVEGNCIVEGTDDAPSNSDIVQESSLVKPDGDGGNVAKTDTVEEQNGILAMDSEMQRVDGEVKVEKEIQLESGNESTELEGEVKVEKEIQLDEGEVKVEKEIQLESGNESTELEGEVKVEKEIQLDEGEMKVEKEIQLESGNESTELEGEVKVEKEIQLESGNESMELEGEVKVEEQIQSESVPDLEENQGSSFIVIKDGKCESQQLHDGIGKSEEPNNLVSTAEVDEVLQSQTMVLEADHSDDEKLTSEDKISMEPITKLEESEESKVMVSEAAECKLSLLNEEPDNLESTAVTQKSQESQIVVLGAVEPQLPEVETEKAKSEEQTELGSAREVEESLDSQITVSESAASKSCQLDNGEEKLVEEKKTDFGIAASESCQLDNGEEKLVQEKETDFGIDVKAEQKSEILVTDSVVNLDQGNESANLTYKTDVSLEIEIANDSVSDTKISLSISHVEDGISETEVLNENNDGSERTPQLNGSSENAESSNGCMRSEIKFGTLPESCASLPTGSDDSTVVEQEVECASSLATGSFPTCSADDSKSENEVENLNVKSRENIIPCPVVDAKLEIEENGPDGDDRVSCHANYMSSEIEDDGPKVVNVEKVGAQFNSGDGNDDDKIVSQETKGDEGIGRDGFSTTSPEGSSADGMDGLNMGADTRIRPFRFLIRIPRYDDENHREQIGHAQLQLDEKTQVRDAIRVEIQTKRANCEDFYNKYDAAKSEEIAARGLLKSKFQEIESIKSVLDRVKSAISVEGIDGRIQSMEHMIEHETLPLKEEKQFIREIKQLKHLREQHSSNMMSSQDEVRRALDDSVQMEERLKILKKEVKSLKDKVSEAKVTTDAAEKIYIDENKKLKELKAKFRAADSIRQEAYAHLQRVRRQLYEKNKHFRMYKDDAMAANDYESSGNREALYRLCVNQVERIMELWNKDDEFRKEYVRCNTRSTLRRLNTLDGRSLGPDEEPPVLPNVVNDRVDRSLFKPVKANSVALISTNEQGKQGSSMEGEAADRKTMVKVEKEKNQAVKTKKPAKPVLENVSATVSGRGESEETKEEEHKPTKEEQELARKTGELAKKAEELRKEEAAAKLREERLLEEKAKAKEALERKKRNLEKAQMRAELRAQKEAEQKEKEREKRAKKKERKKAVSVEATDGGDNEGVTAPTSENPLDTTKESEMKDRAMLVTKRPQKLSRFTKQSKVKPIPPPLRNKGRRKMQTWMWGILAVLVVLALFLLGNSGFSFNLGLQHFGF